KLADANSDESAQLARENELLRNIVVRERQEEARRDETRKRVVAQLDKLQIRSETLNQQIEYLAQPATKLSSEELALLRQPVVSVSDQRAGLFKASFVFEKKSAANSDGTAKADANTRSGGESDARINRPDPSKTNLSPKVRGLVRAAGKNFQQGNYKGAEKQYQQILAEDPNNLDAADAHFNLTVILITTQPGSKELAKEHYARATALGIEPSASLEKLLQ